MAQDNTPISPVTASAPELTISAAAVNEGSPAELDSKPTSPDVGKPAAHASREEMTPEEQNRRAQLHKARETDPAVVVDIVQTPNAEEFEKSGASQQGEEQ